MATLLQSQTRGPSLGVEELLRPEALQPFDALETRAQVVEYLTPIVERQVRRLASVLAGSSVSRTVYDEVYAGCASIGCHWTVGSSWMGFLTHSVSTYTVALAFDSRQQPSHFIVSGAREVETAGVAEEELARAVDAVVLGGPQSAVAPHFFQAIGI